MQLKQGTKLQGGKYRILRTLGQGGFGITYEAEHVLLGKKVAVKEFFMKDVCNRDSDSGLVSTPSVGSCELAEKFKAKFIKEARTIVSLEHTHIVKIHDVFEENGTAYYIMDLIPGGSLADKVKKEGPLTEAQAEKYIRQVARALDFIHAHNTVHLDVKPSNILLSADGDAILIDFGISKHYDDSGEQTSSTPVGMSKGYAPMEQYRDGDVGQFKPTTDIYSLGATLYYLVSGMTPPEASIVYEDGLEPLEGVSAGLWHAIEKAMEPRRKNRPQSIAEFLALLPAGDAGLAAPVIDNNEIVQRPVVDNRPDPDQTIITSDKGEPCLAADPVCAVDLGLPSGVKWANCNLGAAHSKDPGVFYAWGELESKKVFNWEHYKFRKAGSTTGDMVFSKYGDDKRRSLAPEDDPARHLLGAHWSVPTETDFQELIRHCQWVWLEDKSAKGYQVIGPNKNSIFLPITGFCNLADNYGRYWTSTLNQGMPIYARSLNFSKSSRELFEHSRFIGLTIRPVWRK